MRNPDRIPNFCYQLAKLWEKQPDFRFGQFIEAIKSYNKKEDVFYIEDDEFLEMADKFIKRFDITYEFDDNIEVTNEIK